MGDAPVNDENGQNWHATSHNKLNTFILMCCTETTAKKGSLNYPVRRDIADEYSYTWKTFGQW